MKCTHHAWIRLTHVTQRTISLSTAFLFFVPFVLFAAILKKIHSADACHTMGRFNFESISLFHSVWFVRCKFREDSFRLRMVHKRLFQFRLHPTFSFRLVRSIQFWRTFFLLSMMYTSAPASRPHGQWCSSFSPFEHLPVSVSLSHLLVILFFSHFYSSYGHRWFLFLHHIFKSFCLLFFHG